MSRTDSSHLQHVRHDEAGRAGVLRLRLAVCGARGVAEAAVRAVWRALGVALLLGTAVRGERVAAAAIGGGALCLAGASLIRRGTR